MRIKIIFSYIAVVACCLSGLTGTAQAPVSLKSPYDVNVKLNYVRTWETTAPEQNPAALLTRPLKDVKQTTAYFDGLGRPLQTVVRQGSLTSGNSPVDLVSPVVYDPFGREQYNYLPFGANNNGGNTSLDDGLFKLNPFQQQAQFYNTQLAGQSGETNINGAGLNWAYGQTAFEPSPLNRVQEAFAPGASWAGSAAQVDEQNRHSVKTKHYFNAPADEVKNWTVTDVANNWGIYVLAGDYGTGQLYKTITVDEAGKQVIEFKDKDGQVILKKVQLTAPADNGTGSGHAGWLCTYYVYDDLNNLRLVIQPRGVEVLAANSWNINWNNNVVLTEQCFRYEYDARNRMIRKKVPGAGEAWTVYDKWDRQVLTQDSNLRRQNAWIFTKYDALNRPVYSGKYTNATATTLVALQAYLDTQNMGRYETYTPASGLPMYTLSQSFPAVTYSEVLSVTYYDDYVWANGVPAIFRTFESAYNSYFYTPDNTTYPYAQSLQPRANARGLVTGTIQKALDGTAAFATSIFYDEKGRVIQTKAENYSWGCDITTTQYTFSGQVLKTVLRHEKLGTNPVNIFVHTDFVYDDLGRIKDVKKNVNGAIAGRTVNAGEVVIASHEYDALGQLKKKTLAPGVGPGGGPLETLDYDYNVRGWMLGTNRKYLLDQGSASFTDRHFGFELAYDKTGTMPGSTTFSKAQYNGNIAGTIWKSRGDQVRRKFDFEYDAANRFGKATFIQNIASTGGAWNTGEANFSVHGLDADNNYLMKYDANGNILGMVQHGVKPGSPDVTIDALRYKYKQTNSSNQLEQVWDDQNVADSKLGDFHYPGTKTSTSVDYVYDGNGNLVADNNKNITGITYSHLNLPQVIQVNGKGSISYTYDFTGVKHRKLVQETGKPDKVTLYMAGFVYENDTLQFLNQEEGRIRYVKRYFTKGDSAYQLQFDYFLKDHLGNVRMVLTPQTDTAQYLASMETAARAQEEKLFYNIGQTAVLKTSVPGGYPADQQPLTNPNDFIAKANGSGNKLGPAIVLKVMHGDKVDIGVRSFYRGSGVAGQPVDPVADLLVSLATGVVGIAGESKGSYTALTNTGSPLAGALNSFRTDNNSIPPDKPKAYLNWILLDEQLKYVPQSSGADVIKDTGVIRSLTSPGAVTMAKNGYLYIYVSNETPNRDVFFDNLSIQHITGPLLEETHYYPFGLTMAGISSKAIGGTENKIKFNGIEQNTDLDLNMYDAYYRNLDPQIGRFWQIDPKIESAEAWSPYSAMLDDPVKNMDPLGDSSKPGLWSSFKQWVGEKVENAKNNTLNEIAWVRNRVSDAIDQAGENFNARWAARADPLHQFLDNPFSMIGGPVSAEVGLAENLIATETKSVIKAEFKSLLKADVGNEIGILRDAAKGKGNFGLGKASIQTSDDLGKAWVGDGAKLASDGRTLVSKDGLRQYRPPSVKKSSYASTGVQSNFEWRNVPKGQWQGNGHLNITPPAKPFWKFW